MTEIQMENIQRRTKITTPILPGVCVFWPFLLLMPLFSFFKYFVRRINYYNFYNNLLIPLPLAFIVRLFFPILVLYGGRRRIFFAASSNVCFVSIFIMESATFSIQKLKWNRNAQLFLMMATSCWRMDEWINSWNS